MNKLTKQQSIIISAYTGYLAGDVFSDMHKYIEQKLGRPVMTHEMGSNELAKEIREAVKNDFLLICYEN